MKNLEIWAKNFNINLAAAFITILILTVIGIIIYTVIPDNLDINFIQNTFAIQPNLFVSEKAEFLTYIINTLLFIPLFCLAFVTVKKYFNPKDDIKFLNNFSACASVLSILFLFIAIPSALHFYFDIAFNKLFIFLLPLFVSIIFYFLKDKPIFATKTFITLSLIFLAIYILKILFFYPTHAMAQSYIEAYHFEAFSYPIYKTEQGLLPAIDFRNIYGYYPYFYALFADIIGPLNTFKITFLTALIFFISWACGIFYIYKTTQNKLFAFLLSIVFVYLTGGNYSYYLQFAPLRIIAFSILLFIATLYTQKQKNYLLFFGFFTSVLALVWNFETGLINLITWTCFVCYIKFNTYTVKDKKLYIHSVKYLIYGLISFCLALIIFKFLPYVLSGKIVNLADMFFPQHLFYENGFMMEKIRPLHPWFLPLIIYITALILALQPVLKKQKNEDKDLPLLVFLAIFGFGIYAYYQGRSFLSNLIMVLFPALLILPILTKKIYQKISFLTSENTENIRNLFYILYFVIFQTIGVGAVLLLNNVFILNRPKAHYLQQDWPMQGKVKYLAELVQDKNPLLFVVDSSYYYKALNKKDNFPLPAPIDIFFKSDYDILFDYLEKTHTPIVFDMERLYQTKVFYIEGLQEFIKKTNHKQMGDFILFEYK